MRTTKNAVTILATAVMVASSGAQAAGEITFVSWGGAFQEAERKAWLEPIAAELGITIKEDTLNGIADVRTQLQSGKVTWDIVELGSNSCVLLEKEGGLEKLDYNVINADGVPKQLVQPTWIGDIFYGTVIGWNTETVSKPPKNWAEFWDAEKIPGMRSMYNKPYYNLEAALLADGVPADEVYPIDADRAFKKLEEIKPHVLTWWKSGAASAQLIKDGEVDVIQIWNGRIQNAMKDGAQADLTFNEQILDFDCIGIPKGAPNKDLAMKVMALIMEPRYQARLPLFINYAPTNDKAYEFTDIISPELAAQLPSSPANRAGAVIFNPVWWAEHQNTLQQRFDLFVQQ